MSNRGLPPRPDVEQYKKQAKELIKSRSAAEPEALERIGTHHPRLQGLPHLDIQGAPFKLSDAQLTIAREHGFPTWSQFTAHIQKVRGIPANTASQTRGPVHLVERIKIGSIALEAHITGWGNARGIVLFPQSSGTQRFHPSYRYLAQELHADSICTVLVDADRRRRTEGSRYGGSANRLSSLGQTDGRAHRLDSSGLQVPGSAARLLLIGEWCGSGDVRCC